MYTKEFIEKLPDEAIIDIIKDNISASDLLSEEDGELYVKAKKDVQRLEIEIENNAFALRNRALSVMESIEENDEAEDLDYYVVEFMNEVASDLGMCYSGEYVDTHPSEFWLASEC